MRPTEGFADLIGKYEDTFCSLTNLALSTTERWCTENNISLNPRKMKLVLFTNRRKPKKTILLKLGGMQLELAKLDHAKFLGKTRQEIGRLIYKKNNEEKNSDNAEVLLVKIGD